MTGDGGGRRNDDDDDPGDGDGRPGSVQAGENDESGLVVALSDDDRGGRAGADWGGGAGAVHSDAWAGAGGMLKSTGEGEAAVDRCGGVVSSRNEGRAGVDHSSSASCPSTAVGSTSASAGTGDAGSPSP